MRKLLLTLIICCCTFAAVAENVVSASSASGHPQDEVTLQISLANTDDVVAFQTEIPLGDNLSYVANSVALNADRITDHGVTAAVVNGNLRIFAYSLSLTPFVGNEGTLVSFTLKLKNEPGDNAIDITNSKLSDALGASVDFNANNGSVTILSPKISINTGTIDYGHVPIWSEYTANATVSNVGNEPLTITAISFNDAVFSCPTFAETTVQPGDNTSFTFRFAPMVKGAVNASATIVSNSISGNAIINLVADPFAVNEFHFTDVSGYCDSIVAVPMTVNNMENLIGFQIDVKMPAALEYVSFELSNRKTDHVAFGVVKNDTLRFMAYSPTGAAFTGNDGVIGTLRVRLHGLYGYYFLDPFKAVLADAVGENVLSEKYQGYVNIRSPQISGNTSLSMGSSSVTETVTKEYEVWNYGDAQMRIDQVVFDQPDWSVAETFPLTVEQYSNVVLHVSYSREQKGDFTATMKIYSNDPQNGLKNVALSGNRYEPNILSMEADPFTLEDNDVAITIAMDNYSNIVALQADFEYPYEDYSVAASDFQLTGRFGNHTLYAVPVSESVYKIIVFSLQNGAVDGNDGVVVNVTLHPIGEPEDKDYSVALSNIVLSGNDGVNIFSGSDVADTFRLSVTQSSELVAGWNWWSTYIEQANVDGLNLIEESLNHNGMVIKSHDDFVQNYYSMLNYDYWYGGLENIVNENSYMVETSAPCEVDIAGRPTKASVHPITIKPNWNWIGYPVVNEQLVSVATGSYAPENNDVIKSHTEFATYYSGYGWYPDEMVLTPGEGYLYKSNAAENKTLTYDVTREVIGDIAGPQHNWIPEVHKYADNISVIASVILDENEVREEIEVGAFVNGECRGSAILRYFEPTNRYYAMLSVAGEEGDEICFEIPNARSGMSLTFNSNDVIGSLDNPVLIEFATEDSSITNMPLYPNPVERGQEFIVVVPNWEKASEILITNALGEIMRIESISGSNIKGLDASGIYMVKIICESGNIYINKLIVK